MMSCGAWLEGKYIRILALQRNWCGESPTAQQFATNAREEDHVKFECYKWQTFY
jgi:hypothetical protein